MKEASEEVEASGSYVPLDRCGGNERRVVGVSGQTLNGKKAGAGLHPVLPAPED